MRNNHGEEQDGRNLSAKFLSNEEPTQKRRTCKICFLEDNQNPNSENLFISPCCCTGSLQYVHKDCMSVWMEMKWKENDGSLPSMNCEICLTPLKFNIFTEYNWTTCQKIKTKIIQNFSTFLMFIIGIVGLVIFSGVMIGLLAIGTIFEEFLIFLTIVCLIILIGCFQYLKQKFMQEEKIKEIFIYEK